MTRASVEPASRLPPGPAWPKPLQHMMYLTRGRWLMQHLSDRFGTAFTVALPFFGPAVVISDPPWAKALFRLPLDATRGPEPNIGTVLGKASSFNL